jgi:hypothetical protein
MFTRTLALFVTASILAVNAGPFKAPFSLNR